MTPSDKEFVGRLLANKDDTSWRAAKTIEMLHEELEKKNEIIYEYFHALNGMKNYLGEISFDKHNENVVKLKEFTQRLDRAVSERTVIYSRWHGFKTPEKEENTE